MATLDAPPREDTARAAELGAEVLAIVHRAQEQMAAAVGAAVTGTSPAHAAVERVHALLRDTLDARQRFVGVRELAAALDGRELP